MANKIHSHGGPRKAPQPSPRSAPAPPTSGPTTAEWVSGTGIQNQPELRRFKKKQKEKARRQRRGEGRRYMAQENKQVVGGAQHEASEEKTTHQTADPVATRRRTEDVGGSSNQVVAVAVMVAAVAEDIQVVVGRPQNEPSADNKVQAADLAVARRTEDVGSISSQVVAAAIETEAPLSSVAVAGPPSASSFLSTTKSESANNQQALARLRLGSLLLPLIQSKFRKSTLEAAREKVSVSLPAEAVPAQPATKAVDEAGENASPKQSAAEMAVVLRAEAVRLEEMAVAAKVYAKECAEELAEQLRLEERLLEEVTKQLDTRAQELSFKKKTCEPDTLGEADKIFEEMYTGKAPVEYGCVHRGSDDSGNTYTIDSSESTCDKQNSEGTGLEGQQCLPPLSAARSPMPPVQPGVCLVNFKGTYYPVPPSPVQQQHQQQQADQAWAPEGCSSGAEHQIPMEDVQPQAFEYGHNAVGMGPSPMQSHMQQPHPFTHYGESFEGMELPTQQQYAPLPMSYGGDANYPVQMPHEQPLHTAYRGGSTEGSMLYPLEAPQYPQPFGTTRSERYFGWGVYNQPPILGYEGGYW